MANNKKNGNHKPTLKYEVHQAATLLPPIPPEEYKQLVADIKERGLREPILMQGNMLLDGRHRMQACEELGIKPVVRQYDGKDVIGEILSRNVFRRHLTDQQRVMLIAEARAPQLVEEAEARKKAGVEIPDKIKDSDGSKIGKATAKIIGEEAKVGQFLARQAIDVATHGTKKMAKDVIAGKHPLAEAAREARRVKTAKKVKKGKAKPAKAKPKAEKTDENVVIKRFQKWMSLYTHGEQRKVRAILLDFLKN